MIIIDDTVSCYTHIAYIHIYVLLTLVCHDQFVDNFDDNICLLYITLLQSLDKFSQRKLAWRFS